jgi:peptide/nickel transport system permease protein
MARYLIGRLAQAVIALFVISVVAFALTRLIPGDPARVILGSAHATPKNLARVRHQLGLDQPLLSQFGHFLAGAVHFEFGESIREKQPVSRVVAPRVWPSLLLSAYACTVALVLTVPFGVFAALRRNRIGDHLVRFGTTIGYATPEFVAGFLLILLFSVNFSVFPVEGYGRGFAEHLRSLTLPALTVAFTITPLLLRTLRSEVIDTLGQDYVEAAHARGLSEKRVLVNHVLRNSTLATLTVFGVVAGVLVSGLVIIENVFSIPGLGSLLVTSVSSRDYPVIQALVLIFASCVVIASLVTDLLYLALDPRIRR